MYSMYPNANENCKIRRSNKIRAQLVVRYPWNYEDVKTANDVYRIELKRQYVSDALKDEFQNWTADRSVFLAAPTGAGKNRFIETVLIPFCRRNGKRILLLSNRVALGRQEKRRLATIFGMEKVLVDYTDTGLDKVTEFGNLEVISFQQLECWINHRDSRLGKLKQTHFDYVVIDEAHYFLTDCNFNSRTDISLDFIGKQFQNSVRIYMTATPFEIFPVLKKSDMIRLIDENENAYFTYRNWLLYEFQADYSWIHPYAFESLEDLVDIVERKNEKWLIFVDSIDKGSELKTLLKGDTSFITSQSKNEGNESNSEFMQIVKEEKCDRQIIITTSVLENGVNIKDRNIKNVAIFSNDKIQFLQMLGRVRRYSGASINLYIPNLKMEKVNAYWSRAHNTLSAINAYVRNPTEFYNDYILNESPRTQMRNAFTVNDDYRGHLNSLLKIKTEWYDWQFWSGIKSKYREYDEFALLRTKFSWIGMKFDINAFAGRKQYEQSLAELKDFFNSYSDRLITKDEQNAFKENFSILCHKAYGPRKNEKKRDTTYGLATIKKILIEREIPFSIENKRDGWQIIRKEDEDVQIEKPV